MLYGEINRGYVKSTKNQIKKHYTQMSERELDYLKYKLNHIDTIEISEHLYDKITVNFNEENILSILKTETYNIIEFNQVDNYSDERVLVRSTRPFLVDIKKKKKLCDMCFVVSIKTNRVITLYYNERKDGHDTINFNRYNADLKIIH